MPQLWLPQLLRRLQQTYLREQVLAGNDVDDDEDDDDDDEPRMVLFSNIYL